MSQESLRLLEEGRRRQRAGFRAHAARLYRRVPAGDPCYADALALLGMVRFEEGRVVEAAELVGRAVRTSPHNAAAWSKLGTVARHQRRPAVATNCHRRSMVLAPGRADDVVALALMSTASARTGLFRRALVVSPLDETAALESGNDLVRAGRTYEAALRFRRLLAANPAAPVALFNLGNALRDLKWPNGAERLYRRTLCLLPGSGNVLNNLGLLAFNRADWAGAEACFAAASRGDPRHPSARSNRARALLKLDREPDAVLAYKRGLLIGPADLSAYCELSGLLDDGRWARRAMVLNPASPQPYNRLAVLATKDPERAQVLNWLRRSATLNPDDPDAWYNIGIEFGRVGDSEKAAIYGTYATHVNERHGLARLNTAFALLAMERFREGWQEHTHRLEIPENASIRRFFDIPEWTDEDVAGRHLLLWGEQGIGDEVQFLTLVPYLRRLGARLTILTEERLRPLVGRSFPDAALPDVSAPGGAVEDHHGAELHLALGDLPHRLNLFCGGDAAPEPWVVPDTDRAAALRSGLQARHPGKRLVGITWRSMSPKTGGRRTIAPALWHELASVPGIAVVSLQYGAEAEDLSAFATEAGIGVDNSHGVEPLGDLDGLAALVSAVDLVVCPANNTVHFAGALAKPCWTLLPTRPDWRWGHSRTASLWYPETTIYRQDSDDDWEPVMTRVAHDLRAWAGKPPEPDPDRRS